MVLTLRADLLNCPLHCLNLAYGLRVTNIRPEQKVDIGLDLNESANCCGQNGQKCMKNP